MLASNASINRRTFLETRQLKLPRIIPLREEGIISLAREREEAKEFNIDGAVRNFWSSLYF